GSLVAIPIWGMEKFNQIVQATVNYSTSDVQFLKYLQLIQSVGLFIVPSIILAGMYKDNPGQFLQLEKKPFPLSVLLAVCIVIAVSPFINITGLLNSKMSLPEWMSGIETWMRNSEENAEQLTKLFLNTKTTGGLLFNIFMIGMIPAIGEELLFRGIFQRIFVQWTRNKHLGVWIAAILFSALHFQFYGFIPRALLGVMFGYMLILSGNLWLPVIAHFINNTVAVIAYYLYNNGTIGINPDELGNNSEYGIAGIVSLLVVIVLFIMLKRYEVNKANTI
ncbi:MAG: CPBP family intramembrane metalloprotease, partial [Prolixibacteraceae bacterium]|nr:CPBP family intramembrane metalloprotease [Prolixibacteraceae bacterium]